MPYRTIKDYNNFIINHIKHKLPLVRDGIFSSFIYYQIISNRHTPYKLQLPELLIV